MMTRLGRLYRENRAEFWRVCRYLAVGGWNTIFGIGFYTLLIALCGDRFYLALSVVANVAAVTNAYLGYRYVVFRSQGPFWREYFKCYSVYAVSMLIGMAALWLLVSLFGINPVWANMAIVAMTTIVSYFGHRFFSFASRP